MKLVELLRLLRLQYLPSFFFFFLMSIFHLFLVHSFLRRLYVLYICSWGQNFIHHWVISIFQHVVSPYVGEFILQECDINLDGELDREEFRKFIRQLTKDTFIIVSQGLIITLAVAPTVALLTKKSTEGVPGVGKVVQKVPSSVYASLVTLAIVLFQNATEKK